MRTLKLTSKPSVSNTFDITHNPPGLNEEYRQFRVNESDFFNFECGCKGRESAGLASETVTPAPAQVTSQPTPNEETPTPASSAIAAADLTIGTTDLSVGIIVGSTVGAVILLAGLSVMIFAWRKKNRGSKSAAKPTGTNK